MTAPVPSAPPVEPPARAASPAPPATPPTPAPQAPAATSNDRGFPENTPITEMTDREQVAYYKFHSRKHEGTVKDLRAQYADYDQLKAKAEEADLLRKERETDQEKALREATDQTRKSVMDEFSSRLVAAEFRAASAGRIDADRLATLTEDIDMSRYLKADGAVDLDKVTAKVDAWSPKPDPNAPPPPPQGVRPDPSQGPRGGKATLSGREMFEARRKRQPASS